MLHSAIWNVAKHIEDVKEFRLYLNSSDTPGTTLDFNVENFSSDAIEIYYIDENGNKSEQPLLEIPIEIININ